MRVADLRNNHAMVAILTPRAAMRPEPRAQGMGGMNVDASSRAFSSLRLWRRSRSHLEQSLRLHRSIETFGGIERLVPLDDFGQPVIGDGIA